MELSYFKHFRDTSPSVTDMEAVVRMIRDDQSLRHLTESHRSDPGKGLKDLCPLFAVPSLFKDGKAKSHIVALTGLSLVDIDHVDTAGAIPLDELKSRIEADPHTLLCYTTVSGHGLRVIYRYDLDPSYDLQRQMQFYPKAFAHGNAYYARLLGVETDGQCKDVTRLSVMCHDPTVYHHPQAVAFTAAEIQADSGEALKQQKAEKRRRRELKRLQACYDQTIRQEVEAEGATYAPGSHNDYVMRVGYKLNQFGFREEVAESWASEMFADYDKAASVIASCYRSSPDDHGTRGGQKRPWQRTDSDGSNATVEDIRRFLSEHIQLRRNVITSRVEYLDDDMWKPITDHTVNSLWTRLSKTQRVNVQDIFRVIESDYVPDFHPFLAYLSALPPPGNEADRADPIRQLAETVTVKGGEAEQALFCDYLRKWLVAMVAAWVDESVVNNVILVLIGEQGSYKTTWFNYLLPPELKQYFYTKTNANRMGRDDLLTLAQYGLVCCEELDTMRPSELSQLKAAVTMPSIDERAAYARYHEHRKHIASFCGTGNNTMFLSDPTGNRRWLPFEVESIRSPRDHPFDYEAIYAEAYRLYKSGYQFWFSREEILRLTKHNRQFETPKLEHELVDVYFRKPSGGDTGEFMPVARALQIIGGNTSHQLSAVNLGRAFMEQGFSQTRLAHSRGYLVVQRQADEIKARLRMMAGEEGTDDADPF